MNDEDFQIDKEQLLDWAEKMVDCEETSFNYVGSEHSSGIDIQLGNTIIELRYHHSLEEDGTSTFSFVIGLRYHRKGFNHNGEPMKMLHTSEKIEEMDFNKIQNKINTKAWRTKSDISSELTSYFRNSKLDKLVD